jgi:hypothetical protein
MVWTTSSIRRGAALCRPVVVLSPTWAREGAADRVGPRGVVGLALHCSLARRLQ